jgi:hypothetical protein
MECAACDKELKEGEDVFYVTRGTFDATNDTVAEIEEIGAYHEACFPAIPSQTAGT